MTRMADLQARRRVLLARCAQQRVELAQRLAVLRPHHTRAAGAAAQYGARHPLAWMAVLAGLMLTRRTRQVLSLLVFLRSAVAFVTRAAALLRLIGQARAPRSGGTRDP
jgi:hypothetical protein